MFLLFALLSASLGAAGPERAPDEATVQKTVALARRGDRAALERLYAWHVTRVVRVVRPFARNDADAEDLTQETFVRAFSALDRYEPRAGARFLSWLCTIARNTALKRAKRRARAVATDPDALSAIADTNPKDASDTAELSALKRALLAALAELPERDRWVLCLRYGGELEVAEVAELSGLTLANVRKICERQRTRISARLRQAGFGNDGEADLDSRNEEGS